MKSWIERSNCKRLITRCALPEYSNLVGGAQPKSWRERRKCVSIGSSGASLRNLEERAAAVASLGLSFFSVSGFAPQISTAAGLDGVSNGDRSASRLAAAFGFGKVAA